MCIVRIYSAENISFSCIPVASAMIFAYTANADIAMTSMISDSCSPCRRRLSKSASSRLYGLREHFTANRTMSRNLGSAIELTSSSSCFTHSELASSMRQQAVCAAVQ